MNTTKDSSLLFANENAISLVASIAKIVSWILLVFYLVSFANDLSAVFQGQMQWPTEFAQWPITIVSLFFAPMIGLFYFLVLQGVAQGLNLGLDIYYELHPEETEEDEEEYVEE